MPTPASRPLSDLTDQQLLALVDQHRDQVYNEMARRYYERIHQFLFRMVRRRDVADDLTQDTFDKALQAFRTDPPRRKLWDWIYRIANNTGVDYLRTKRPETVELDQGPEATPTGKAIQPAAPPDEPTPTPPLRAKARDLKPHFERAAALLRGRERLCFVQHYLKGRSYDDIAQSLGLPRETVKSHVRRARNEVKKAMGALPEPSPAEPGRARAQVPLRKK